MFVTRDDIVRGLRELGVREGGILMVHSALSSLGQVQGGADAVIDALCEVLGPTGTLAMPTLYIPSISSGEVFDVDKSPSQMGEITETFRKRPGVLRSVHPTHPIAAFGPRAADLIRDHAKSPTACGKETPFGRLADWGGKVLLLGVDQDRNTLLHTAEDYADCPYLSERKARYRDPLDGQVKEIVLQKFPGPHRNFIGLDPLFRESGVMRIGKIGNAVCRLMDAGGTVHVAVELLKRNPAAVLCDNPECADCVSQRGFVRQAALAKEDFIPAVRIDRPGDVNAYVQRLWAQGITAVEIGSAWLEQLILAGSGDSARRLRDSGLRVTGIDIGESPLPMALEFAQMLECPTVISAAPQSLPELQRLASEVQSRGFSLLIRNSRPSCINTAETVSHLKDIGAGLAFDPSEFALMKQNPFLQVYYHGLPKSLVKQLYVKDGTFDGRPTEPGQGNGEVKELISILRCRSFSGPMVIWPRESIESSCEAFRRLLESM